MARAIKYEDGVVRVAVCNHLSAVFLAFIFANNATHILTGTKKTIS